jgi:uncharacterized protein (PEP-CTERM system associated)
VIPSSSGERRTTMMLRRIIFAILFVSYLWAAPPAYGADLLSQFHPSLTVKGEYNDNINLTSANKKDDYITTVQPGLKYSNMDKVSGVDLDALLGFVFYGKNSNLNYLSANANLNVKYMTTEHINFYFKDSFTRSDSPREQEYFTQTADNKYVLATQAQRAVYWRNVAAPTVEYQFGPENRVGVNYRNNIYQAESGTSQNSMENYINPFMSYWFDKRNGIYLEYGYTNGDFQTSPDLSGHRMNARYTNRFGVKASAFADYTYSIRNFTNASGLDYDIHEPVVGVTYAFTPTFNGSVQVGYYLQRPKVGSGNDGLSFKGELVNLDPRTTYRLSVQGGYTEDYFTSQNLGFQRYYRLTGSLTHFLEKRLSVGCLGSVELSEYGVDNRDTIWGVTGTASYVPAKWLTLSLEVAHRDRQSNVSANAYTENRVMALATATY